MKRRASIVLALFAALSLGAASVPHDRATAAVRDARAAVTALDKGERRSAAEDLLRQAEAALTAGKWTDAESLAHRAKESADGSLTRITVVVEPSSSETRFIVQGGSVEVSTGGSTAIAHPGEMVRTGGGTGPRVVEVRLAAPEVVAPDDGADLRAFDGRLRWNAVERAVRYQVTIARDALFHDRVATIDAQGTSATLGPGLAAGSYYWHVAATGGDGSEGPDSSGRRFRLDTAPPALAELRLYWLRDHHCPADPAPDARAACAPWIAVDTETGVEHEIHSVDLKPLKLDASKEQETRTMLVKGQLAVRGTFRNDSGSRVVLIAAGVQGRR